MFRFAIRRALLGLVLAAPLALADDGAVAAVAGESAPPAADEATGPEALMAEVYAAARTGSDLYDNGQYAEALAPLLEAAQRGFKLTQAKVGDIYLHGRGVDRDVRAGLGWLGAAASQPTTSAVEDYYAQVLAQLPDEQRTLAARLAQRFSTVYGGHAHGVDCQLFGEVVEELRCRFLDDPEFDAQMREASSYDGENYVEEMVVTAPVVRTPAPEPGQIPSGAFISEVYEAANRGSQLYREKRYKEALPFLVVAAKRGFKWAQASAADIYLHGRGGVPSDLEAGIGWLGVAAEPRTSTSILAYYNETRDLLPERFTDDALDAIVADYRAQYGNGEHRVACRFDTDPGNAWSFNFKTLRCHFIDEATQCQNITIGDEIQSEWTCKPIRGSRARDARPY